MAAGRTESRAFSRTWCGTGAPNRCRSRRLLSPSEDGNRSRNLSALEPCLRSNRSLQGFQFSNNIARLDSPRPYIPNRAVQRRSQSEEAVEAPQARDQEGASGEPGKRERWRLFSLSQRHGVSSRAYGIPVRDLGLWDRLTTEPTRSGE